MSLILFLVFWSFSAVLVLVLNYYRKLFSLSKESFQRDEIIDLRKILLSEMNLLASNHLPSTYVVLGISCVLGFIANHMGGLYGAHYESYFFNSIAVPGVVSMAMPYLKDNFYQDIKGISLLKKLFDNETTFLYGISVTIMAQMMVTFGVYHSINFLWVLLNYIGILVLIIYHIYSKEKETTLEEIDSET